MESPEQREQHSLSAIHDFRSPQRMILLRAAAVDTEILTLARDRSRGSRSCIRRIRSPSSGAEVYAPTEGNGDAERELGA